MKTMIQVHLLSNFLSKNNSFLGMNDTPSTLSYMQKSVFFIHDYLLPSALAFSTIHRAAFKYCVWFELF